MAIICFLWEHVEVRFLQAIRICGMPSCISSEGRVNTPKSIHLLGHLISRPPQLPDNFTDAYMKEFGVPPPPDVITHCRRELYHEVIKLILQGRFAEAYKHGIPIKFPDGIIRRVFPRFYCYSADYPEKSVNFLTDAVNY